MNKHTILALCGAVVATNLALKATITTSINNPSKYTDTTLKDCEGEGQAYAAITQSHGKLILNIRDAWQSHARDPYFIRTTSDNLSAAYKFVTRTCKDDAPTHEEITQAGFLTAPSRG